MKANIKRIYEPAAAADGYRILVDRLWPRGITKEKAKVDKWLKDIAPSTELRKWFNHEPEKWKQFVTKYHQELKGSSALKELCADLREHKQVTMLHGAKDKEHNQAKALLPLLK